MDTNMQSALEAKDAEIAALKACIAKHEARLLAVKNRELAAEESQPAPIQSAEVAALLADVRAYIDNSSQESGYGYSRPANPHDFCPDEESCMPEEIAAHKAACEAYDKGEYTPERRIECVGNIHILSAPWGIGSYTYRDAEADALLTRLEALAATPAQPIADVSAPEISHDKCRETEQGLRRYAEKLEDELAARADVSAPTDERAANIADHLFIDARQDGCWHVCVEKVYATEDEARASCRHWIEVTRAWRAADVKEMVNRFLGWPLPKTFGPDCGVTFKPLGHPNGWPVGTNLLTANEAKAMFEHCLPAARAAAPVSSTHRAEFIERVLLSVAELPDRDSPEDQPEMMLVTGDELKSILLSAFEFVDEAAPVSGPTDEVAQLRAKLRETSRRIVLETVARVNSAAPMTGHGARPGPNLSAEEAHAIAVKAGAGMGVTVTTTRGRAGEPQELIAVSGQGASIASLKQFHTLALAVRSADEVSKFAAIAELATFIDSRPRSEDSRPTYIKDADEVGGLCSAILAAIYKGCQRGDSPERLHGAVMGLIGSEDSRAAQFKTESDLAEFLDSLHATEGVSVTNQKWEPAQRALSALVTSADAAAAPAAHSSAPSDEQAAFEKAFAHRFSPSAREYSDELQANLTGWLARAALAAPSPTGESLSAAGWRKPTQQEADAWAYRNGIRSPHGSCLITAMEDAATFAAAPTGASK